MQPNLSEGVQSMQAPNNLVEFLGKCLNRTILEYKIKSITKYGDHAGSELQALDVKLNKNNDSNEVC